jgi:hypothetical protein
VSAWAYECRARDDSAARWFVSRAAIDELPRGTHGVLVRVGDDWLPAVVDRSRQVAVDAMLLHDVIADEEFTGIGPEMSAESESRAAPTSLAPKAAVSGRVNPPDAPPSRPLVRAAAISMAGTKFMIVLVSLTTASGPGEADLVIADMHRRFGVPIVLMGQQEDGTPVYYGDEDLKHRLTAVPVDRMPWKEYTLT